MARLTTVSCVLTCECERTLHLVRVPVKNTSTNCGDEVDHAVTEAAKIKRWRSNGFGRTLDRCPKCIEKDKKSQSLAS